MPEIKLLDNQTIDKIAAGEVVEKPASVVKELVENAMDAGANAITVEIKGGGIDLIRVTDDGCGIPAEEVPKAFLRHATSKIQSDADLFYLQTLGFRGEALASIAAVAQVEMITKTKDSLTGTRITIEGGIEKEIEEVGAPNGTTIIIRNLFYNVPARKKFLKSAMTEGSYIVDLMQHMAQSMPGMSFKLIVNNDVKFHTSGNGDLKEVIYRIYGRDITKALIPISVKQDGIEIEGYLGKPELSRANRNYENYFVNRRYVRSNFISNGIEEGYKGFMMQHQFPFCVLHINVDSTALDVNVHPTKMQVRMTNQQQLTSCLTEIIRERLTGRELIPDVKLTEEEIKKEKIYTPEPFEKVRLRDFTGKQAESIDAHPRTGAVTMEDKKNYQSEIFFREETNTANEIVAKEDITTENKIAADNETTVENVKESIPPAPVSPFVSEIIVENPAQMDLFEDKILTEEKRKDFRVLGQVFQTYWLIEFEDKLYFMDQHAAHEKVKYEAFLKKYHEKEILSQNLTPAVVVTLSPADEIVYREHEAVFERFGFETDFFGGNELMIRAVPMDLYGAEPKEMFLSILEELAKVHSAGKIDIIEDRIATMACKAAVKGNHSMTHAEAQALIDQLLLLDNPYQCPHGRPTFFSMTKYEMEKKFKRIV